MMGQRWSFRSLAHRQWPNCRAVRSNPRINTTCYIDITCVEHDHVKPWRSIAPRWQAKLSRSVETTHRSATPIATVGGRGATCHTINECMKSVHVCSQSLHSPRPPCTPNVTPRSRLRYHCRSKVSTFQSQQPRFVLPCGGQGNTAHLIIEHSAPWGRSSMT